MSNNKNEKSQQPSSEAAEKSKAKPAELTAEQLQKAQKTFQTLGEVVTLMAVSPQHKYMFLADLDWLALPAIVQNSCFIQRENGRVTGVIFWASVSGAVEDRLKMGVMKLAPAEWRSGENIWIIQMIDPLGKSEQLLRAFADSEEGAAGQAFKFPSINKEGKRVIARFNPEAAAS